MYVLSPEVLKKIKASTPDIISKLALTLSTSSNSIYRFVRENEINGDLTKLAALEVFQQEFNMSVEQILEKSKTKKGAAVAST
jgi:hypothetical protein